MSESCCISVSEIRQRKVLWIALSINAAMFLVESAAAVFAGSTGLLADAFDMLGDAAVYGISLYAVGRGIRWQSRAARVNGWLEIAFGLAVIADVARRLLLGEVPAGILIMAVALLALAANVICAVMLMAYRHQDINMHAVWLCTRNDAVSNVSVIAAGGLVVWLGAQWPDLVTGLLLAGLFLYTGIGLVRTANARLRAAE